MKFNQICFEYKMITDREACGVSLSGKRMFWVHMESGDLTHEIP